MAVRYGEGGIRTPDKAFRPYNGLANRRLQPLGHLSRNRRTSPVPSTAATPRSLENHLMIDGNHELLHSERLPCVVSRYSALFCCWLASRAFRPRPPPTRPRLTRLPRCVTGHGPNPLAPRSCSPISVATWCKWVWERGEIGRAHV